MREYTSSASIRTKLLLRQCVRPVTVWFQIAALSDPRRTFVSLFASGRRPQVLQSSYSPLL